MNDYISTKDIDSKSGWAISRGHDEAWTTESRFRRVYHLAPCEEIVVFDSPEQAESFAEKINGNIAFVSGTA